MRTTTEPTTGRTARTSWWDLSKEEWKAVLRSTLAEFKADKVPNLAAVVTLRLVLALIPGLIAGIAIAAQVISTEDIQRMVTSAGSVIPGSARAFVVDTLDGAISGLQEKGTIPLVISILAGLFAATGAAGALIEALNAAYDVEEGRGFVGQRVTALAVIAALALALIGMFVAIVLGPTLLELLLPQEVLDSPLSLLITLGRYVAGITILILFFGFAFWFGPNRDRPALHFLSPGAVIGVIGWLLLSWLFGIYVSVAGSYSATYGTFAGPIVLIVWLNYSFTVLLMGAELDHELNRMHPLEGDATAVAGEDPDASDPDTSDPDTWDPEPADLDAVDPDMPRHPGLVPPADDAQEDPDVGLRGPVPTPVLVGAARHTPGGKVAGRLWGRISRG